MKQKQIQKDHGKTLYDSIIFLLILAVVLWFLRV